METKTISKTDDAWMAGIKLGFKVGLLLSVLYTVAGMFIVEWLDLGLGLRYVTSEMLSDLSTTYLFGIVIIFIVITVLVAKILLAIICGSFTGMILGKIANILKGRISSFAFIGLSIAICGLIAMLFHIFFHINIVLSFESISDENSLGGVYGSYLFNIGIPTLIYILAGGWAGMKLYSKA